jgi:hypothetical protein
MVTVLSVAEPPGPDADNLYVVVAVGVTLCEPLRSVLPIGGLKLTDVALVVLHDKMVDEPAIIVVELAVKVEIGIIFTATFTLLSIDPAALLTVIIYVVLFAGDTLLDPLNAVLPIGGLKLTDVALSVLQVKVHRAPGSIVVWLAEKFAVGTMLTVTI